jgi:prolyl 4-hydroxylase
MKVFIILFLFSAISVRQAYTKFLGAFAGGFGPKRDTVNPKERKVKKKIKTKGKWDINTPQLDKDMTYSRKLDKWGLPIPTEDDIFPPLDIDAEIIPAPMDVDNYSTSLIVESLTNYLKLDFSKFDENGIQKAIPHDKNPMVLRMLHASPPVISIENFLSESECQEIKNITNQKSVDWNDALQVNSATFSALSTSIRTSTSWFCYYRQVPLLLAKVVHFLGIPLRRIEEPQIVRYRSGEQFSWHYDEVPQNQLTNGGQRLATFLVYLNDVQSGGGTVFRDLKGSDGQQLTVKPRMGNALLFFPAFADGKVDERVLHKGETAQDIKWICQMWIHQNSYTPVTPPGNSHLAAVPELEERAKKLGYETNTDLYK